MEERNTIEETFISTYANNLYTRRSRAGIESHGTSGFCSMSEPQRKRKENSGPSFGVGRVCMRTNFFKNALFGLPKYKHHADTLKL